VQLPDVVAPDFVDLDGIGLVGPGPIRALSLPGCRIEPRAASTSERRAPDAA
jgi:hypothetical protein